MTTPKKEKTVGEMKEMLSRSSLAIFTDYRGLKVSDLNQLRKQLRDKNAEYHVTKNTLLNRAAKEGGITTLDTVLEGPTATAFCYGDIVATAKTISDFARVSRVMTVKGGLSKGRFIGPDQITALATMPPREVLLGQVLGTMQAPLTSLVTVLSGNIQGLLRVLQARQNELGGETA